MNARIVLILTSGGGYRAFACGRLMVYLCAYLLFAPVALATPRPVGDYARMRGNLCKPNREKPHVIISIMQLRHLSSHEAALRIPVKVTGVVTDLSGYQNSFFFQDATGGVSVDRTDSADVHTGNRVEISGTSGPGLFAPVILASRVVVLGQSSPPPAPTVSFGDLVGGYQDSQWVQMDGIIHSVHIDQVDGHTVLMLHLEIGGGAVSVLIHDFSGMDIDRLVDAKVRLHGVCASDFNQKRQFVGVELYVPSIRFLQVLEPAKPEPFSAAALPVATVLQFGQVQHRVKVNGISTYQLAGKAIYLQDGGDGIRVEGKSKELLPPGRRVEAVGFPVPGEYGPILQDAIFRDMGPAKAISPPLIEASDVLTQLGDFDQTPYEQQLVQIEAVISETHIQAGQRVWLLKAGSESFEAHLAAGDISGVPDIRNGSTVLLTGICVIHVDLDHRPASFDFLLRTADDIRIVKQASWWTAPHALAVLGLLAGGMIMVVLWVLVLRHRVEQQTRIIRQSEERFRHLAQHDYLTGLPNRLSLENRIEECLSECKASLKHAAVFTVDIDKFKNINDTYGHLVGDECLKIVAARLRTIVRQKDVIARTGGEEFTLVVGGLPSLETALSISASIIDLFQCAVLIETHNIVLTVSVGGALYPENALDPVVLRKMSDEALYMAKRSGRNRAVFATP